MANSTVGYIALPRQLASFARLGRRSQLRSLDIVPRVRNEPVASEGPLNITEILYEGLETNPLNIMAILHQRSEAHLLHSVRYPLCVCSRSSNTASDLA